MREIIFDAAAAGRAADKLREIQENLVNQAVTGLEECREELERAWQGRAAGCFRQIADCEIEKFNQTDRLLRQAEEALMEAIQKAGNTEEKIKEIAEIRKY